MSIRVGLRYMARSAVAKPIPTDAFRKSHEIDGTVVGAQTDYQMKINVHYGDGVDSVEDVYLDGKCEEDFGDVRFTEDDGVTELDYWIEKMELGLGEKIVDDGGLSVSPFQINIIGPQALRYVGTHNRTYVVYQDAGYDPKIMYFDHTTETWSLPVKVAESPIDDNHGCPALLIDQNGYLHVFYGCHATAMKHAKSDSAEDISAWTVQADVDANATYPIARIASNGDIYVFYRSGDLSAFRKSTDDGATWEAEVAFINLGAGRGVYQGQVVIGSDDSLHIIWCNFVDAITDRQNIYYAYSTDGGSNWKAKDGTDLGAVITLAEANANCLVYDSTGDPAVIYSAPWTMSGHGCDLRLDASDEPFITFVHGKAGDEWQIGFARWNVGTVSWDTFDITTSSLPFGFATLDYVNATDVKAYCRVNSVAGQSIELWESVDNGGTWNRTSILTGKLFVDNGKLVENYLSDLQFVWGQREDAGNCDVYAYGDKMTPEAYAVFWVKVDSIPQSNLNIESGAWAVNGETYNNRTKIAVEENSGGDLTDYQVKVTFNTKYLVDNGYATAVGDEIRFTNSDGSTLLDFWLETAFDDEETVYWVKVPSLLASEERNLYIYYDADLIAVPSASTDFREDFTDYTEVDPSNHWEQITRRNTGTGVLKGEDSYVWKDYGADYFGDFEHRLTIYTTSIDNLDFLGLWAACNVRGSRQDSDGLWHNLSRYDAGDGRTIEIRSVAEVGLDFYGPFSLTTPYYLTIRRYGTSFTCLIYSDAERTNLLDTLSLTVATTTYRYLQIGFSSESGTTEAWSGYCESLHLRKYVEPEPSVTVEMDGEATIYVYYGKADEATTSDGETTFPSLFDDFANLDDWSIVAQAGTPTWEATTEDGVTVMRLYMDANGENLSVQSDATANRDKKIRLRVKEKSWTADSYHRYTFHTYTVPSTNYLQAAYRSASDNYVLRKVVAGVGTDVDTYAVGHPDGWYIYEVRDYSDDVEVYRDVTLILEVTESLITLAGAFRFENAQLGAGTSEYVVDWIFIAKYVSPEPAHGAWGAEEPVMWPF